MAYNETMTSVCLVGNAWFCCRRALLIGLRYVVCDSELGVDDLRRRVLVTLWQISHDDPRLDRLLGATSFGLLNVACNKTVSI